MFLYNIDDIQYLRYFNLISSIPLNIKMALMEKGITYTQHESLFEKLIKSKEPNKLLYDTQLKSKTKMDIKSETKWSSKIKNKLNWSKIYTQTQKATIDVKLRSFQYKFLMRILPTNKSLYQCNISESNLCYFCNMQVETLEHLFWECHHVQHMWNRLGKFLSEKNLNCPLNFETICFGKTDKGDNKRRNVVNFILILMKSYIFQTKYNNRTLNFDNFVNYLKTRIKLEQEIALINDKLSQHNIKWAGFEL